MANFEQEVKCEAQLAEVEMMEAAYCDNFQLVVDGSQASDVVFDIILDELSLRLYVPNDYPTASIRFLLNSAGSLSNSDRNHITTSIQNAIDYAADDAALGSMEICQMAIDMTRERTEVNANLKDNSIDLYYTPCKKRIARFLIYFHHIMSGKKRVAIVQNARELGLGGYSKHGFPGIVIVEGYDYNVLEYVRRIQHLRWQQMVVRGEEFDDYIDESENEGHNFDRRLPMPFREIEGDSMSDIAALCQECKCRDLFMTAMKKY